MSAIAPRSNDVALRALIEKIETLLGERGDRKSRAVRHTELDAIIDRLADAILAKAGILSGNGTPEGKVTAKVGMLYRRLDGGASTTFYVKQSGTGNTGWAAK